MRTNPVKEKLRRGEVSFGTWLAFGDLYATRLLARMGYDWLTLDMEHSAIDWSQATSLFGAIADAGCVPLCRVPEGAHHYIKRALDAGAMGIVVPMVDTVEQAKIAVDAAYYPPKGNRSVGGGMHSMNFGATAADYYVQANDNILVVLQTESPRGVQNAEAIYSLPGVDAIFIGPNDLRFQMRTTDGTFPTNEQHEAMVQQVITVGKKVKCPTGIHSFDPKDALMRAEQGMRFIAVGSDLRFMSQRAAEVLDVIKPQTEKKEIVKY
jgi:4-hydroxy-2-oxoheptanedioate aldolase